MKIQIISLQRTGSKSLEKAIQEKLPNRLRFDNGDELGEILHLWGEHGYKFGPAAQRPFDKDAEILFHTNKDFAEFKGTNFTPLVTEKTIRWEPIEYQEELDLKKSVSIKTALMHQADLLKKDLIIKSQLAFIEYSTSQMVQVINGWDALVFLTPSDIPRWVCSNYLCDTTGIFAPVKEQQDAANNLIKDPVTIPRAYILEKTNLLNKHYTLQRVVKRLMSPTKRTRVLNLTTESLNSAVTKYQLRDLKLGALEIPVVQEFSNLNYHEMIKNYADVCSIADWEMAHVPQQGR